VETIEVSDVRCTAGAYLSRRRTPPHVWIQISPSFANNSNRAPYFPPWVPPFANMPSYTQESSNISATYNSPAGQSDFAHSIPAPQSKDDGSIPVEAKSKYLSDLRTASKKLQEDINKFLTQKMEEDKKAAGQGLQNGVSKKKTQDELEEENYGEENVDET
jgi:hypothetical protein